MIFIIMFFSSLLAFSHEISLLKEGDTYIFSLIEEGRRILPDKEKVDRVLCFDRKGNRRTVNIYRSSRGLVFEGNCALLGFLYRAEDHTTFIKYLSSQYEGIPQLLGFPLEITYQKNPVGVPTGKKVTFRVFHINRPLENAPVWINYEYVGRTRRGGEIRIRLREGLNVISTYVKRNGDHFESHLMFKK